MMKSYYCLVGLLLVASVVSASSSQEALQFAQSKAFAQTGETLQLLPEIQIQYEKVAYWVVAIVKGNQVQDYLALKDVNTLSVETANSKNQALFKTAAVLRSFLDAKNNAQAQSQWFFTRVNAQYFNQLSSSAKSRQNDLALVRDKITSTTTLTRINTMESILKDIDTQSVGIAAQLDAALKVESDFYAKPTTADLAGFQQSFDLDESLAELKSSLDLYSTNLNPLLNAIASDPVLETEDKAIKTRLLATPDEFKRFADRYNQYTANSESIDGLFSLATQKSVSSSSNVATRVKRSEANNEIENKDELLFSKTNQSWATLMDASAAISSKDYRDLWKDQKSVKSFENHYQSALDAFNQGRYDTAILEAKSAKADAVTVFKAGFESQTTNETPAVDSALVMNILWLVLGIAVVVFVAPKLLAMLQQQPPQNQS